MEDRGQGVGRGVAGEGPAARQHLVQHGPEREDVRAMVRGQAPHLLRGHVAERAQHHARLGRRAQGRSAGAGPLGGPRNPGQAEVEDLHATVVGHEQVGGLEIAVHDALRMGGGQPSRDLHAVVHRLADTARRPAQDLAHGGAFQQLRNQVGGAVMGPHVEENQEVRMAERSCRPRLLLEAAQAIGVGREGAGQDLQRDLAADTKVFCAVDLAHASSAQGAEDFVGPENLPWMEGHGGPQDTRKARTSRTSSKCMNKGIVWRRNGTATHATLVPHGVIHRAERSSRSSGWTRRSLMMRNHTLGAIALVAAASLAEPAASRRFDWTTSSPEARKLLGDLQSRIESFQFGTETVAVAERMGAADPKFAMGAYYLSAVAPAPGNQKHLDRAVELSRTASDGEKRFIDAMVIARANQGANSKDAIPSLEKLAADYPEERLVQVILGQLYQAASRPADARTAFERADRIGPPSSRVRAFLANDDLLRGDYEKARRSFLDVEKGLPKGAAPFAVRYGLSFSYLYEGKVDPALASLKTYLAEYKDSGAAQGFPEVFIWNSIARINLENGRLEEAMKAYESGYESVPRSSIADDQKQVWLGRLHHGRCRVLAKMGKHEEAWAEAEKVKKMIEDGGEAGKQYLPAYHYLAGYLKLEAGDPKAAVAELQQANAQDPFHTLLLARAYEKVGDRENARKAYQAVLDSGQNGLERALAFPEARRKLSA